MQVFYLLLFLLLLWNIYCTYLIFKLSKAKIIPNSLSDQNNPSVLLGLHRFNALPESTGDQSFSVAILDNTKSGFVLTGLYTKNITKFYAKGIKNDISENLSLSPEEKLAILNATKPNSSYESKNN